MNILKVGWLIFLILLVAAGGGGYYLYHQQTLQMQRHLANIAEISRYEAEQSTAMEKELEYKEDLQMLENLAKGHDKWWFLQDIEEVLGQEFQPLFRSIGSLKVEDKADYVRISRAIKVEASYPELIRLLEELEKKRGFAIEQLKIVQNPNNPGQHKAQFVLSSIEIKKGFFDQLRDLEGKKEVAATTNIMPTESLIVPPPWKEGQKLVLREEFTDPFVKYEEEKVIEVVTGEPEVLEPIDLSATYRLEGIVQFPQYRVAIVSPNYILREGDWLEDKQITSITESKVVLHKGEQEYYLTIPGFTSDSESIKISPPTPPLGEAKVEAASE